MRWASTVSTSPSLDAAVEQAAFVLREQLAGAAPDLATVFVSQHHRADYDRVPRLVASALAPGVLIGCSAGGVIGGGHEVEDQPALSVTAAVLPDVELTAFWIDNEDLPPPGAPGEAWSTLTGVGAAGDPHFVLLPDPFTFDAERLVGGLDVGFPASVKVGGLASGAREPGGNALYLGDGVHRAGAVGVALAGDVLIDTIVAQGCRPIGEPMFVTACDRNLIRALDGRPALDVLRDLMEEAEPKDHRLFAQSLFLGVVMQEQQEYRQGDFLIRNLLGVDGRTRAIAVGAPVRTGIVVQFHLRDAETSADDLKALLARYRDDGPATQAAGSLLFACLGRGRGLYGRPDHDTDMFRRHLGALPLGGFFCNGEIGPVHGATFLHGYTSSFGLFRPRVSRH